MLKVHENNDKCYDFHSIKEYGLHINNKQQLFLTLIIIRNALMTNSATKQQKNSYQTLVYGTH